jgi:hypothetical protein
MEWLAAFFVVTGAWVWFWATVCFVLVLAFSENDKNFWAFVSVAGFIALMHHSEVFSIFADPFTVAMWAGAYFVAGATWSVIKWFSFVNKEADKFGELKLQYINKVNKANDLENQLEANIKTKIPEELIVNFNRFLADNYHRYRMNPDYDERTLAGIIPSAMQNKEKIVAWILWWPTSAFWTILNDPLVRFANWIYSKFQGLYKKIAHRAFAKFGV